MTQTFVRIFIVATAICGITQIHAQNNSAWEDKFKQLGPALATPNNYRTASGAPGNAYWQQRADYTMNIRLDDQNQRIYGDEKIVYFNNSPDVLNYLWLQLDQNLFSKESDTWKVEQTKIEDRISKNDLEDLEPWFDGGFKIDYVQDGSGNQLAHTVNKTMMRIDLKQPLKPGANFTIKIKWWYNINDRMRLGGRSGYEYFEDDKNYLYTIAQFYPRMVVYADNQGWQHKQFLGAGEFTLNFGNYEVRLTVPADHIVAATGVLQNPKDVLTAEQIARFEKAKSSETPIIICTQDEAIQREKNKLTNEKTWIFKAENVRDFGFASSRKFIWDAQVQPIGDKRPLAMSFYPKEGNPLWEQYSTRLVAHTLKCYSKFTIDYPYPVAISVNAKWIGMEYPMICFNGGRPEKDGTYSEGTRNSTISVIVHEVGHNFFPMIINSDERQWTWMDEGLNSFVQYLTEKEFDRNYPSRRGPVRNIVDYMRGDRSKMSPIMTNSESIYQFGNNAYGKPATALNVLRETVMGRELFDFAFKEYSRRWAFKHPTPDDFFRTMEDASAIDLDWFWRGWFYGTEPCDMALKEIKEFRINTHDPVVEKGIDKNNRKERATDIAIERDKEEGIKTLVERDPASRDFYTSYDPTEVIPFDQDEYQNYLKTLSDDEKALLKSAKHYYQITFENVGGLVMPLIVYFEMEDGSTQEIRLPAEIWKMSEKTVTKVFPTTKKVVRIVLDPYLETADIDLNNNQWPARWVPTRFELFKERQGSGELNPMQKAKMK